jgi:hypothetical protein
MHAEDRQRGLQRFTAYVVEVHVDAVRRRELQQLQDGAGLVIERDVEAASVPIEPLAFAVQEIAQALDGGLLALVLIDQAPMMGYPCPHWVLVHGHGGGIYFLNDPWIEPDRLEQKMDVVDLPIMAAELDRMAWYGNPAYRAAVLVGTGSTTRKRYAPSG